MIDPGCDTAMTRPGTNPGIESLLGEAFEEVWAVAESCWMVRPPAIIAWSHSRRDCSIFVGMFRGYASAHKAQRKALSCPSIPVPIVSEEKLFTTSAVLALISN